jgi:glycosyltransferase involved in cell wall biosynthesis
MMATVISSVKNGNSGKGSPPGALDALAEAIAMLANRPDLREAMGQRGEQKVYALHTWDRKYPLIRDLYLHLLGNP